MVAEDNSGDLMVAARDGSQVGGIVQGRIVVLAELNEGAVLSLT